MERFELKYYGNDYKDDVYLSCLWEGWITFGHFMERVFDAIYKSGLQNYIGAQILCRSNHDDVRKDESDGIGGQYTIEIVPEGNVANEQNFLVTNGVNVKTASIGIECARHIDEGRRVREFKVLGVEFEECQMICCIPPFYEKKGGAE